MRLTLPLFALTALITTAACAPSAAEVRTAHEAHYRGPPANLLKGAALVLEAQRYRIKQVNRDTMALATNDRVWDAEGGVESAGANGVVWMSDNSIAISYVVRVMPVAPGQFTIVIKPRIGRNPPGSPLAEDLRPDDPSLPGWVRGKIDHLAVAIHDELAAYVVPAPPR